jgi:predicted regulator of Ras-like GTPase activity (Roadblock/LC7/MglB family)
MQSAEGVARMVWSFVEAAGGLVEGLDKEDEVKLLRVRTKKHELVIVPDSKFLLVVIHETPPA